MLLIWANRGWKHMLSTNTNKNIYKGSKEETGKKTVKSKWNSIERINSRFLEGLFINKRQTYNGRIHESNTLICVNINQCLLINPSLSSTGTTIIQVTATDADDPMFGNNAKLIYSILEGEPYFSVEPKTGANQIFVNNLYALNSHTKIMWISVHWMQI